MPKVQSVYFGRSPDKYDNGDQPACAVNAAGILVEMHRGETEGQLYYRIAVLNGLSIEWADLQNQKPPVSFDTGFNPSVALMKDLRVVEVHDSGGVEPKLFYSVRSVVMGAARGTGKLSDATAARISDETASDPSVAVNASGVAVEVHRSGSGLKYRVGQLTGQTLTWPAASTALADSGSSPSVAIDDDGRVVVVYEDNTDLRSVTGTYVPATTTAAATIRWNSSTKYDDGRSPSVALGKKRWVYEVHQGEVALVCHQRVGRLSDDGTVINWMPWLVRDAPAGQGISYEFDDGVLPQVATNGVVAVQVHKSEAAQTLFTTASAVFDRGHWMEDNLDTLKNKSLSELVIAGSHDAGQYQPQPPATRTQKLPIYGQLAYGVRYFDLRPYLEDNQIHIHHGPEVGVLFQVVLDDVRAFMKTHNELVILKVSHYGEPGLGGSSPEQNGSWSQAAFNQMVGQIQNTLGQWLPQNPTTRIARLPLKSFVRSNTGAVLVVADTAFGDPATDYVEKTPQPAGIYHYRDWEAPSPKTGDLRVFDVYGNTDDFQTMVNSTASDPSNLRLRNGNPLPRGQFPKFDSYNGKCLQQKDGQDVNCDLFLLSWTLTPDAPGGKGTNAADFSQKANKQLVDFLTDRPTAGSKIFNILFTDTVQDSRSSDVAFVRNGLLPR